MHYWDNDHMDGAWAVVMILGMVGFWVLLAVVIIWAVRFSRPSNVLDTRAQLSAPGEPTGYAEQILANRLARGEIDPDEYRTKIEALRSAS